MRAGLVAILSLASSVALAENCKAIQDPAARLACFDKPAATVPPAPKVGGGLDFGTIKQAMNAQYASYFSHHKTSLIGSRTVDGQKVFFIRVPDADNPNLQIAASCLDLDAGGWMCTLRPNYGTFGPLPLAIKSR